ncbi:hypothetical protein ACE193_09835 [Bernardetia sp. OM2101]|uniref:hypothetical protein n=1 Tax=Bernardetia sp. OM2101 TaxID=3344876 RepID=UPI0035D02665
MAYQLDLEKGFLEIDLGNITSGDFIEEHNLIFGEFKKNKKDNYEKFEVIIKGIDLIKLHDEDVLFRLLLNILCDIETLSKDKFPVTVLWYYQNEDELEMGNMMNDLLDEYMTFEFLKIE